MRAIAPSRWHAWRRELLALLIGLMVAGIVLLSRRPGTNGLGPTPPRNSVPPGSSNRRPPRWHLVVFALMGVDVLAAVITGYGLQRIVTDLLVLIVVSDTTEISDSTLLAGPPPTTVRLLFLGLLAALAWWTFRASRASHGERNTARVLHAIQWIAAVSVTVLLVDRVLRHYDAWHDRHSGTYLPRVEAFGLGLLVIALALLIFAVRRRRGWLAWLTDATRRARRAGGSPVADAAWILALSITLGWAARRLWRPSDWTFNYAVSLGRDGLLPLLAVVRNREWSVLLGTLALALAAIPSRERRQLAAAGQSPLVLARVQLLTIGVPVVVGGWLLHRYADNRPLFHLDALPPAAFVGILAVLLWLGLALVRGRPDGGREELGAALLGGVLVAAAIFALQVSTNDQRQRAADRQQVQLTVAARQDLSNYPLAKQDLSGMHLEGKKLDGVDLSDANLSGAHLEGASLVNANLSRADLSFASLAGVRLVGAFSLRPDSISQCSRKQTSPAPTCVVSISLFRST